MQASLENLLTANGCRAGLLAFGGLRDIEAQRVSSLLATAQRVSVCR